MRARWIVTVAFSAVIAVPPPVAATTARVGDLCRVSQKILNVGKNKLICANSGRVLRWQEFVTTKPAVIPARLTPNPLPPTAPSPVVPPLAVEPLRSEPQIPSLKVTFEPDDHTGYGVGGASDFGGATSSVVADPRSANNHAMKVTRGTANVASEPWAGTVLLQSTTKPLISVNNHVATLRILSPTAEARIRLKLQNSLGEGYRSVEVEQVTGVANTWTTVSFDFTNTVAGTSSFHSGILYTAAVLFMDFGRPGTGQTFYADDLSFPATSVAPSSATPTQTTSPTTLWAEEFNGNAGTLPSTDVWTPLLGDGSTQLGLPSYGTGELVQNTATAAAMDGLGNLVITTRKDNGVWSSARLWTQGKVNFLYGKLEARIRFPVGSFNWPSFWMLGKNYQAPNNSLTNAGHKTATPWPNSGEIDIAEGMGGNSRSLGTIHGNYSGCTASCGDWFGGAGVSAIAPGSDLSADFHTFGILWKPQQIAFTFDGAIYAMNRWEPVNGGQIWQSTTGAERLVAAGVAWPFDLPFLAIIQNTIPSGTVEPDGTTARMYIDWIRYSTYAGYGTVSTP